MQQQKCFDMATESDHTSGVQAEDANEDTRTRKEKEKSEKPPQGYVGGGTGSAEEMQPGMLSDIYLHRVHWMALPQ